ncbi:MAG: AlkZ family DNA glycosylase [Actinobacteria bacterium]|nr:AlkZ family DNA glycosylase [Actinomycetota bacterium]
MGTSLTPGQLRAVRWQAQLLGRPGPSGPDVAGVARHLGGLQAQAAPPARLAVRPRTAGLTAADVDQACANGLVTRTWAMRGTLHLVATTDVRWMTGLLGPFINKKDARRRSQLGLTDELCERALAALASILAGSARLTRAELIERLAAEGVGIDPRTQQPPHLLGYAAGRSLICRGPDRPGDEPTYVLLDEWAPAVPALERDEALAELARRYLGGYGPASRADFATWSGLPTADCGKAWALIADETVPAGVDMVALDGAELDGAAPSPRLLGHFDPLLMGYRDRELILAPGYAKRIQAGGGFVRPTVLVGGRVAGTWRLERKTRVTVEPFAPLAAGDADALAAEATDVGRFLGTDVTFQVAPL